MLESSTNGSGAAVEAAAAAHEDQRGVDELGFVASGRAAPVGVPDPELVEQANRRKFTAKYKLEILERAEACTRPGEVGELLRREGLYTSHLTYWRKQVKDRALKELGKPRGRKPADRRDREIAELTRRAERAEKELAKAKRSSRSRESAPRGALSDSRCSREELEGGSWVQWLYPDPKGERDHRLPGKRRSGPGARAEASRDPRDMAKA